MVAPSRSSRRSRWPRAAGWLAVLLLLSGCGGGSSEEIIVSAGSSLTEVVESLAATTDGPAVIANIGGSQALASQIIDGAPADVFLSANPAQMTRVADAGLLTGAPVVFARNELVLVVAAGNPFAVAGAADLAREDLVVVLADPSVPVGGYTAALTAAAGVTPTPASLELSVRSLVTRIALGDADLGVAYVTDTTVIDGVEAVPLPPDLQPEISYVAGALTPAGERFVMRLVSEEGAEVLQRAGFLLPSS